MLAPCVDLADVYLLKSAAEIAKDSIGFGHGGVDLASVADIEAELGVWKLFENNVERSTLRPMGLRRSMFSMQTAEPNSRQRPKSWMASGWTTMGHLRHISSRRRSQSGFSPAGSTWLGAWREM